MSGHTKCLWYEHSLWCECIFHHGSLMLMERKGQDTIQADRYLRFLSLREILVTSCGVSYLDRIVKVMFHQ